MASLGNTIINGSLRCLNKIYANDLQVGGTTSFAGISGTTLSISGNSTFNTLTATGTAVFSKAQDLSGTANNSPALIVGGTATQGHIEIDSNEIQAKGSGTTTNALYINTDGGAVYLSNGSSRVYASNGTLVAPTANFVTANAENLNVTNTIRSAKWDMQTVFVNSGGSLYISPTINLPSVTTSAASLTVTKSGDALTLLIEDPSITSTDMSGAVWAANSRVKVSGNIDNVSTGTMDGTITNINTSSHTMTVQVSGENSGAVVAGSYSATQYSDLSVMMYQRRDGSNDFRVGIWLNCYDTANSSATMRIYGGSDAKPNVLLGNLTNAGLGTVNGMTPTGWGLFAQNAFLHGAIVATEGNIGGFTLTQTSMFSTANNPAANNFYLMPTGTQSAQYTIGGQKTNTWVITSGTTFGVTKAGALYATSGKIGGWNINGNSIYNGTAGTDASSRLSMASFTATIAGASRADLRFTVGSHFGVDKTGKVYCNSAEISGTLSAGSGSTIGAWTVADTAIYKTSSTWGDSTAGAAYFGNNGISITDKFKVSAAGAITADSGTISGFTIGDGTNVYEYWSKEQDQEVTETVSTKYLAYNTTKLQSYNAIRTTSLAKKVYVGTDGISLGDGFVVSADGTFYLYGGGWNGRETWTLNEDYNYPQGINIYKKVIDSQDSIISSSMAIHADEITINETGLATIIIGHGEMQVSGTSNTYIANANQTTLESYSNGGLSHYLTNTERTARLILNSTGQFGLYDDTNSRWLLQSGTDGITCIPSLDDNLIRPLITTAGSGTKERQVSWITANSGNTVSVQGKFGSSTTWTTRNIATTSSDIRLKNHITDTFVTALPVINKMKIREFDWIDTKKHQPIGFIADELEKLDKTLTIGGGYNKDGTMNVKSIDPLTLMAYAVKAIQELSAENKELKNKINYLMNKR